jgi:hypothetical protein
MERIKLPNKAGELLCKPNPLEKWDFLLDTMTFLRTRHQLHHRSRQSRHQDSSSGRPSGQDGDQALASANHNLHMQQSGGGRDQ